MQRADSSWSSCLRAVKTGEKPGVATLWWIVISFFPWLRIFHWPGFSADFLIFMMSGFSTDTIFVLIKNTRNFHNK